MRILLAAAVVAGSFALPASAVKECEEHQKVCFCGTEFTVGLPDKDPILSLGRVDCWS